MRYHCLNICPSTFRGEAMITQEETAKLRELLQSTETLGDWTVQFGDLVAFDPNDDDNWFIAKGGSGEDARLELAAAAVNALPKLLDAIAAAEQRGRLAERERCAGIADDFAAARPLGSGRPNEIVRGRYEGEQNACHHIAQATRDAKDYANG
jgi:hypothetical protein